MNRALAVLLTLAALSTTTDARLAVEVLSSTGGLPPHIVAAFEEPLSFQQTPGGPYYVFDRRGHTVYAVDSEKKASIKLVEIGPELGRILQPRGFDTSPTGSFVVADAPRTVEQYRFSAAAGCAGAVSRCRRANGRRQSLSVPSS